MSENKDTVMTFKKGKIPRNELELPTLHFVVVDQWIDVIGEKALLAWLHMYSWCNRDRTEIDDQNINLWEQAKIPTSYNKIIKRLGVGKDTFYNKILKPLWNVGLIDIEEYTKSDNKGNKPMNIIVYKYPQNNKNLAHQEIAIIRDYDKDYTSNSKTFAQMGGRPKKNEGGSKIEPGGGSEIEPGVVPNENQRWFQMRTGGGSEIEPNNIFNSSSNPFNSFNNNLNDINNNLNSSSSSKEQEANKEQIIIEKNEEEEVIDICINNIAYDILGDFLGEKRIGKRTIIKTILECYKRNLEIFTMDDIEKQYGYMMEKISSGERIFDFAVFFANGLYDLTEQSKSNKVYQQEKLRKLELAQQERKSRSFFVYNWLEN